MQATCSPRHKIHTKNENDKKRHLFERCRRLQNAIKNHTKSRCSFWVTKKNTHAHKLIKAQNWQRKLQKSLKMTPFRKVPTAQKCCKKQYEIKIFVLSDWKSIHASNTSHMLAKTKKTHKKQKKVSKRNRFNLCPRLQNAVKNNRKSRFSSCMTKTWPKMWPTRHVLITIRGLQKQQKMTKKTHFQRLLTAQKCCKKQYRIKIFVLSDRKMHSYAKC